MKSLYLFLFILIAFFGCQKIDNNKTIQQDFNKIKGVWHYNDTELLYTANDSIYNYEQNNDCGNIQYLNLGSSFCELYSLDFLTDTTLIVNLTSASSFPFKAKMKINENNIEVLDNGHFRGVFNVFALDENVLILSIKTLQGKCKITFNS